MNATEAAVRDEICRIGAALFNRGYAHSSAGNISAALEDGFLITPTDACLGFLDPARLAKLDPHGNQVGGDRASKTIRLHGAVYAADRRLRGIVHTHSTHLVALSLLPEADTAGILPPLTPYYVMKVGPVPLIPYRRPGDPAVIDLVVPHVPTKRGVMLASLGPVVWHDSVSQAAFALEELEETARLWLMTRAHRPRILTQDQIQELHSVFGAAVPSR